MATIKGKWRWNETVNSRGWDSFQGVNFTSNGESYDVISLTPMMGTCFLRYNTSNSGTMGTLVASGAVGDAIKVAPEYREIDFGDTEQEVSDEFYNYLVANALELTIAEKLTQIAENEQKVYDAGYEKGKAEGGDSFYDTFWDTFQMNGKRRFYDRAFKTNVVGDSGVWDKNNFKPKYDVKPVGTDAALSMFENFGTNAAPFNMVTHLEGLGVVIDTSQAKGSFNQAFRGDGVTRWGTLDFSQATNVQYAVYGNGSNKLLRVDMIISGLNTPWHSSTFQNQRGITYMRFGGEVGQSIYLQHQIALDKESFYSIVGVLSADASGKSITLSKAGVNKAFETSTGANDGETSAEWIALRGTRSNWTFTLS